MHIDVQRPVLIAAGMTAASGGPPDPAYLDRLADAELQHGHVATAERLAHLAAELREAR